MATVAPASRGRLTAAPDAAREAAVRRAASEAGAALRGHWPEYAIEAGGLGRFMLSACLFAAPLAHPASPVRHALRRVPMGLGMGLTAVGFRCGYAPTAR